MWWMALDGTEHALNNRPKMTWLSDAKVEPTKHRLVQQTNRKHQRFITFYNWVLSTLRFTPVQYIDSGVVGGESIEILNKSPAGTVAIVTFVEIGTSHRSQVLYDLR